MIKNKSIGIYSRVEGKNSQGIVTVSYVLLKTITGNFQPKSLSQVDATNYGVSEQGANAKWFGFDTDTAIHELMRALVDSVWYEVRGINAWPTHMEAILIPVVGI